MRLSRMFRPCTSLSAVTSGTRPRPAPTSTKRVTAKLACSASLHMDDTNSVEPVATQSLKLRCARISWRRAGVPTETSASSVTCSLTTTGTGGTTVGSRVTPLPTDLTVAPTPFRYCLPTEDLSAQHLLLCSPLRLITGNRHSKLGRTLL